MPIFEYECQSCGRTFENLVFPWESSGPTSQCPACMGIGEKLMSAPSIVAEPWKVRMSPDRLPNWNQQNKKANWQDAWTRYRQKNPLPQDKGSGIKVYETDGIKPEL